MKRTLLILGILLTVSTAARADYLDMKAEFEAYTPPPYFESQMRDVSEPAEEPSSEASASDIRKTRIREIRTSWEASLHGDGEEFSFLNISPERVERLGMAAEDEEQAGAVVRRKFSLEDIEALTLLRSPRIKAAERRVRAEIESFSQISNLDEILRQYAAYTEGLMTGVGPMKGRDPVRMKFPFPGVLSLKGDIVNQNVRAAKALLEATARDVRAEVRKTFWNLLFVRKSRNITGETVKLFRHLKTVAETLYKSGTASFQNVIRAETKREILDEDLHTLRKRQRNLEEKLCELLNLGPETKIGVPKRAKLNKKIPPLKSLHALALENRQELTRIRAMIGKTEGMIGMAETMILPGYSLNLSVYEDEAVMKTGSAAMKESFPVSGDAYRGAGLPKMPWYGTNDAYLRQTREKLQALRQDLRQAETMTGTMVQNAWFDLDRATREFGLYKHKILGLSKSALEVSNREYESGTLPFSDVISSHTNWLGVRLTIERKRGDIGVAMAELERVVGIPLK